MKMTMDQLYRKTYANVFGRLIFMTLVNGEGAPFIDRAKGLTDRGLVWHGYAIQMNPFRFKNWKRKEGKCFVVGLIIN